MVRISDDINSLIRNSTTVEWIDRLCRGVDGDTWVTERVKHRVNHPPLIDQLEESVYSSGLTDDDFFSGGAESKPPVRLDAVDLLDRIKRESVEVARLAGARAAHSLEDRLSAIGGASRDLDPRIEPYVAQKVRGWVVSARVITGWDSPPFSPDVPCPLIECERRGTLRIRLSDQVASCIECGTYWDESSILQLGTYVRWASEHLRGAKHWVTDSDGYPIECVECLDMRSRMAERKNSQKSSEFWFQSVA